MNKIILYFVIAIILSILVIMWLLSIIDESYPGKMVLHNRGVGNIRIEKPIPIGFLKEQYFYSFFADGIAYEGFDLLSPPIRVAIKNGPFEKWDMITTNPFDNWPPKEDITTEALKMDPKDMIIRFIVIESDKVKTSKGIGVGSTLKEIKNKYKLIGIYRVPPSFGGDQCSVKVKGLENVLFYFEDKKSAESGGKVVRISIRRRS